MKNIKYDILLSIHNVIIVKTIKKQGGKSNETRILPELWNANGRYEPLWYRK